MRRFSSSGSLSAEALYSRHPWCFSVLIFRLLLLTTPAVSEIPPRELGRQLITKLGCYGCHTITDPEFSDLRKPAPDLRRIASKTDPAWAFRWVMAPRKIRPTTWMPHLIVEDFPEDARATVAYLWENSEKIDYPAPPAGDPIRGEELFRSIGCTGCHLREESSGRDDYVEPYRLQGPNLLHLGSKVDPGWLFAWLKDPQSYAPLTLMPNLRLADQEAADLTAFLMASRDLSREGGEIEFDEAEVGLGRDTIEISGCYGCHLIPGFEDAEPHAGEWDSSSGFAGHGVEGLPDFGLSAREIAAIDVAVDGEIPALELAEGRKLIRQYNCRGCHLVEGWGQAVRDTIDDAGMLPPNLVGEGARVQPKWLSEYLADPSQIALRPWHEARMPTFNFSGDEVRALVSYFADREEKEFAALPAVPLEVRSVALGHEAFDLLSCGRCHPAGPEAAAALGLPAVNLAPSLLIAGRRLRFEWIAGWIRDPQGWLPGTRMPTFFTETESGHYETPFPDGLDVPQLAEAKARLLKLLGSEEALRKFLGDADAVIRALRDYIWSLGDPGEE